MAANLGDTHMLTFGIAIENLAMFYLLKYLKTFLKSLPVIKEDESKTYDRILNAIPNALIVVVVNIAIAAGLNLEDEGVSVVGDVPSGLPGATNILDGDFGSDFTQLLPSGFLIAVVGYMESISVAKAMALRYNNDVDSNQELVGLGAANLFGCFFSGFPTTGGFSRTSVNADAGAKTPLSSTVSAVILTIAVLFLTPLFYHLPSATLATLILFAVTKLFDFETPRMLWAVDKSDFFVYIVTFICTIVLGIEVGILVGAGISIVRLLKEAAQPHVARLGKLPGTDTWRNVNRFGGAPQEEAGLVVVRFDAQMFFANAVFFKELVVKLSQPPAGQLAPEAVVLDCSAMTTLDSSAVHGLEAVPKELMKGAKRRRDKRLLALRSAIAQMDAGQGHTAGEDQQLHGVERGSGSAGAARSHSLADGEHGASIADDKHASASAGGGALSVRASQHTCAAAAKRLEAEVAELTISLGQTELTANQKRALVDIHDPDTDSLFFQDRQAAEARLSLLKVVPLKVPTLFLACVRGPVRDRLTDNERYAHSYEARAKKANEPSLWNCKYPCGVNNPLDQCPCAGCCDGEPTGSGETETEYEASRARRRRSNSDAISHAQSESFGDGDDAGPSGPLEPPSAELLSLVVREDDIGEAVQKVKVVLMEEAGARLRAAQRRLEGRRSSSESSDSGAGGETSKRLRGEVGGGAAAAPVVSDGHELPTGGGAGAASASASAERKAETA